MAVSLLPLWVLIGVLSLLWPLVLTGAPPGWLWMALGLSSVICLAKSLLHPPWALPGVSIALAALVSWHIQSGLQLRIAHAFETTPVEGVVQTMPVTHGGLVSFRFSAGSGPWGNSHRELLVRWRLPDPTPAVGERWRLPLRVMPSRGRVNFSGQDRERSWFAARVHGLASVSGEGAELLAVPEGRLLERWREYLRSALILRLDDVPGQGLVLALALGERTGLGRDLQTAMQGTGTGHLLAISGLHVGLVAVFGFWASRVLFGLLRFPAPAWPPQRCALALGFCLAGVYAGLAGFGTSPQRAIVMLGVASVAYLCRRRVDPWVCWLLAMLFVLILDPLASLRAGFWLSFGAVAVLLHQFRGRTPVTGGLRALFEAQLALGVVMLPLSMLWFQWASLSALVINLVAVPWVSLITLPLVLIGLLALPLDLPAAHVVLHMAAKSAHWLELFLVSANHVLADFSGPTHQPPRALAVLGLLGGGLCLLPRALGLRGLGALFLMMLLMPPKNPVGEGEWLLELLDAGQGQAALIQTRNHLALVDTGPGQPGQWDLAGQVIMPAARALRRKAPDVVIVSHGDMDHAGGWRSLRQAWPGSHFLGNLRGEAGVMPGCHDALAWTWDQVQFEVLHPTRWLPYQGNDSSCVLSISSPRGSALLPGDIGVLVERRLARLNSRPHELLIAPHHGSKSSSSQAMLAWARPDQVWIAAGFANRFGFPHGEVMQRYQQQRVAPATTALCGAMRITPAVGEGRRVTSARRERGGFWRWPAAPECPGGTSPESFTPAGAFRYHADQSNNTSESKE